jgi:hypothetical protein
LQFNGNQNERIYASGFFHRFVVAFSEGRQAVLGGHPGLPGCETETGLANPKAAINNSTVLKQNGITALSISDSKTSSTSESKVECEGRVTLSNATRGPIHYSFVKDQSMNPPFLVRAKIEPDQLEEF